MGTKENRQPTQRLKAEHKPERISYIVSGIRTTNSCSALAVVSVAAAAAVAPAGFSLNNRHCQPPQSHSPRSSFGLPSRVFSRSPTASKIARESLIIAIFRVKNCRDFPYQNL